MGPYHPGPEERLEDALSAIAGVLDLLSAADEDQMSLVSSSNLFFLIKLPLEQSQTALREIRFRRASAYVVDPAPTPPTPASAAA